MVHLNNRFRLIIELISGFALLLLIGGVSLAAAFAVGWEMGLGMIIVFVIGYFRSKGRDV